MAVEKSTNQDLENMSVNQINKSTDFSNPTYNQNAQNADEIDALAQISSSILTLTDNVDSLLRLIIEKTRQLLSCEVSYILLVDKDSHELYVKVYSGLRLPEYRSYRIALDKATMAGWVVEHNEAVVCLDYFNDPRHNEKTADLLMKEGITSLLLIPLNYSNNVTGVLVACSRLKRQFTLEEVRLCTAFANLASIGLRNTIFYSQQKLMFKQRKEILSRLKQASEIHNEFITTALGSGSLISIANKLSSIIGMSVIVENRYGDILANSIIKDQINPFSFSNENELSIVKIANNHPNIKKAINSFIDSSKKRYKLVDISNIRNRDNRLVTPIYSDKKILGYLSVLVSDDRKPSSLNYGAIDYASLVLALEMTKIKSIFEAEQRAMGDFFGTIFFREFSQNDQLHLRAAYLGYDLTGPHRVVVARIDLAESNNNVKIYEYQEELINRLLRTLKTSVSGISPSSVVITLNGDILVIAKIEKEEQHDKYSVNGTVGKIAIAIKEATKPISPNSLVTMGVGSICNKLEEYKNSYEEAKKAIEIAKSLGKEGGILPFEELGIYSILFGPDTNERIIKFSGGVLKPLINYDKERGTNLLETITCYIKNNYGRKETADELFIHKNTLSQRLVHIETLCQVELNDPDTRFAFQLAVKMWELSHK